MKKTHAESQVLKIRMDKDAAFLYQLQNALLLALKERGHLNEMQYRHAAEKLGKQYRNDKKHD